MDRTAPLLLTLGMDAVDVQLTDDSAEVARVASGWLAEHAVDATVLTTILAAELSGQHRFADRSWAVARDAAGDVVGVAVHTPPNPARLPALSPEVARAVARAWHAAGRTLPGVGGPDAAGEAFVRCWEELTGVRARVRWREGLHELSQLEPPEGVAGTARLAGRADLDLLVGWLADFVAEVHEGGLPPMEPDAVARQVDGGMYVLWEDGGVPVSLAGRRLAGGVGRVGPVWTPLEHRRHGYGAAVTAAATQLVLDVGARAVLYTDLANPTSNGVYRRLGYRLVDELTSWVFDPPS